MDPAPRTLDELEASARVPYDEQVASMPAEQVPEPEPERLGPRWFASGA